MKLVFGSKHGIFIYSLGCDFMILIGFLTNNVYINIMAKLVFSS